jgi:hypothetical protein
MTDATVLADALQAEIERLRAIAKSAHAFIDTYVDLAMEALAAVEGKDDE